LKIQGVGTAMSNNHGLQRPMGPLALNGKGRNARREENEGFALRWKGRQARHIITLDRMTKARRLSQNKRGGASKKKDLGGEQRRHCTAE